MSEINLGKIIEGPAERDAIHIAVVPLTAGERFTPGQYFKLSIMDKTVALYAHREDALGVVDPFLPQEFPVSPGQKFYGFLFPNTVTGMRHQWQHPEFDSAEAVAKPTRQESEAWLREFARTSDCPAFEILIKAAVGDYVENPSSTYYTEAYLFDEDYLHFNGRDAHGEIPSEFWEHVENYTGRKCKDRPKHFSCGC